jgi:hypothetical protein
MGRAIQQLAWWLSGEWGMGGKGKSDDEILKNSIRFGCRRVEERERRERKVDGWAALS